MIQAGDVIRMAAGEMVLPDNERIVRELAKYPNESDRALIWERARQIANRNKEKPTYQTNRDAALGIVPIRQDQKDLDE